MSIDPDDIQVLVPDSTGSLSVCSVGDLYRRSDEFDTVDALTMETAFDMIDLPNDAEFLIKIAAVAALNEDGDAAKYWGIDKIARTLSDFDPKPEYVCEHPEHDDVPTLTVRSESGERYCVPHFPWRDDTEERFVRSQLMLLGMES